MILKLVNDVGTRWSKIAERLPGRTENMVKNRYYCNLKQRDPDAPKRRPVKKGRSSTSESSWWASIGGGAGISDVDQWAMWLDAHADVEEGEFDLGSELGPEKLGNLVVNGLDEEQRKEVPYLSQISLNRLLRLLSQANQIIDNIFSLVPPNFVSPTILESMTTSRAPMLEAAISYIEAAQDHVRKLGGCDDLLPQNPKPSNRSITTPMMDQQMVEQAGLFWMNRGAVIDSKDHHHHHHHHHMEAVGHQPQIHGQHMHMVDSSASDPESAAAMAAAMAAAYAAAHAVEASAQNANNQSGGQDMAVSSINS